jgi:hypothetical protein
MKVTNPTYHLKKDGLYWLQEVPVEPMLPVVGNYHDPIDYSLACADYDIKRIKYNEALQRAKEQSIKVGNQNYIENCLFNNLVDNPNYGVEIKEDTLYTLQGSFEVEMRQERCDFCVRNNHRVCVNPDTKAFFSILESKPEPRNMREQIAQILRDNITFSGQVGDYVIHGAIDKILELVQPEVDDDPVIKIKGKTIATYKRVLESKTELDFKYGDIIDIGTGYAGDKGKFLRYENGCVIWESELGGIYNTPTDGSYKITKVLESRPNQNYICVNCKEIYVGKPLVCDHCEHRTFQKTYTPKPKEESQEESFSREDMSKMFVLGLLNRPDITTDELSIHLQSAQVKIDRIIEGIINLKS